METGLFLEQFGHLAEGEGGIKKLREVVLQLAVRGKLVEQDPRDEPADMLLKKIEAERKQKEKEGKIKKRLLARYEISATRDPLPKGWRSVCIDHVILEIKSGGTPSKANPYYWTNGDGIFWASVKDLKFGHKYISSTQDKITTLAMGDGKTKIAKVGEFLICTRMGLGKISICACEMAFNQDLKAVSISSFVDSNYFHLFFQTLTIKGIGTTVDGIVQEKLLAYPLPLPPITEQKRIVAKVDELMVLCDKLEAEQQKQSTLKTQAVQSTLHHLTNPENASTFAASFTILNSTFNHWFDDLKTLKHLRATILQLAVQGKLVPQDPNDEPVSELLKRIEAEKKRLVKEGKIKATKPSSEIKDADIPFLLPNGWQWVRLETFATLITKGSSPKWQGIDYQEKGLLFITSENVGAYNLLLQKKKYVNPKFNEIEPRSILQKNDILMNIVGASIGRTAIYNIEEVANINQAVCLVRIVQNVIDNQFFLHFCNSEHCLKQMFDKQVDNARANLSMGNIAKFVVPLPPLAEQEHIVAKVDELMTLCDQLEAQITYTQTINTHLMESFMHSMIEVA